MLGAVPDSAEKPVNTTIAAPISRRRPNRSEAFPHTGVEAAAASTYAVTTHDSSLKPPS